MAQNATCIPIGDPGFTDALEFSDGKLMLGKYTCMNDITWETLVSRVGAERLQALINDSSLVGFVNWTMLPHMSRIWAKLLDEVIPNVERHQRKLFIDLADPEKRTHHDVMDALKLLTRFQDPTAGRVCVDGVDLRSVTQQSLRRQMGIVLQDPFLFNGTVRENILFGRLNANEEEVFDAAKAVGAHDFIIRLKNGYDTSVEEGGATLSVGQRQLISFARALLADPRILILDEATSSVDTHTEQIIQEALATLLNGRTSFVIAHRLSTIVNADKIVVIHDGKIVEQGTHLELLANQGMYYDLYRTGFQE